MENEVLTKGEDGVVRNQDGEVMVPIEPPHSLEMQEFAVATTFCIAHSVADQVAEMRACFRDHRFQVITWLARNGVEIPLELADDRLHPQVGHQLADQKPVSPINTPMPQTT